MVHRTIIPTRLFFYMKTIGFAYLDAGCFSLDHIPCAIDFQVLQIS